MNGYLFSHFSLSDLFPREYKFSTFYFWAPEKTSLRILSHFRLNTFDTVFKIDDRFIPFPFFGVILNIFTTMHNFKYLLYNIMTLKIGR